MPGGWGVQLPAMCAIRPPSSFAQHSVVGINEDREHARSFHVGGASFIERRDKVSDILSGRDGAAFGINHRHLQVLQHPMQRRLLHRHIVGPGGPSVGCG